MNKLVINTCYGGFGLSERALKALALIKGMAEESPERLRVWQYSIPRYDHDLVEVVEFLGAEASGDSANLEVVTIEGAHFRIKEYDGYESVETPNTIRWEDVGLDPVETYRPPIDND